MINVVFKSRLYKAIFFSLLILSFGIGGYQIFFDYSFIDALYMTVITITTIGFGEVHPFGAEEKIFTVILILSGQVLEYYSLWALVYFLLLQ